MMKSCFLLVFWLLSGFTPFARQMCAQAYPSLQWRLSNSTRYWERLRQQQFEYLFRLQRSHFDPTRYLPDHYSTHFRRQAGRDALWASSKGIYWGSTMYLRGSSLLSYSKMAVSAREVFRIAPSFLKARRLETSLRGSLKHPYWKRILNNPFEVHRRIREKETFKIAAQAGGRNRQRFGIQLSQHRHQLAQEAAKETASRGMQRLVDFLFGGYQRAQPDTFHDRLDYSFNIQDKFLRLRERGMVERITQYRAHRFLGLSDQYTKTRRRGVTTIQTGFRNRQAAWHNQDLLWRHQRQTLRGQQMHHRHQAQVAAMQWRNQQQYTRSLQTRWRAQRSLWRNQYTLQQHRNSMSNYQAQQWRTMWNIQQAAFRMQQQLFRMQMRLSSFGF